MLKRLMGLVQGWVTRDTRRRIAQLSRSCDVLEAEIEAAIRRGRR